MGQTTTWLLPYPEEADPADVPVDMQELCARLEIVLSQLKSGGALPGEMRMWPGSAVPALATYGRWAWADGASYVTATYPKAAANIDPAWRTFAGAADPGASNFRVPDLRGVFPAGMDAMPGGARANRTTRAVAITLAGRSGEETHVVTVAEMPAHAHPVNDPGHYHDFHQGANVNDPNGTNTIITKNSVPDTVVAGAIISKQTGVTLSNTGGGGAHENLPPTVFVPYIVKLDD